jgi:hypothetical protein
MVKLGGRFATERTLDKNSCQEQMQISPRRHYLLENQLRHHLPETNRILQKMAILVDELCYKKGPKLGTVRPRGRT